MTVVHTYARASAAVLCTMMAAVQPISRRASSCGRSALLTCAWQDHSRLRSPIVADRQHWGGVARPQPAARHRLVHTWRTFAHAASSALTAPAEALSDTQQQQIDVFVSFLLEENVKYNLTGAPPSVGPPLANWTANADARMPAG